MKLSSRFAAFAVFLSACVTPPSVPVPVPVAGSSNPTPAQHNSNKIKVVATFSVLGDFVKNIAGDKIELVTLVGADGDTHDYEPTPSDIVKVAEANIVVGNGFTFEPWLNNLCAAAECRAMRLVAGAGVEPMQVAEGELDPHIWQDPQNAIVMVKNIEAGLVSVDPLNAETYQTNAAAYIAKLTALDTHMTELIASLPKAQRKLVTSHDALGYFAKRYEFEIIGSVIASLSTEAGEPSAQDIARLVTAIKATNAKAIFLESITNPKLVARVAQEAGVKIAPMLCTDALGAAGSPGGTYLEAMQYNTQIIVDALR